MENRVINNKHSIKKLLDGRKKLKFKLVMQSAAIGIIVGLIIVCNRVLISKLSDFAEYIYKYSAVNALRLILLLVGLTLIGMGIGYLVRKDPMISGSGIPQVEGILMKEIKVNPIRVLLYKFIGGTVALGVGLSAGREGPSVQMGACVGQAFSRFFKRNTTEENYLLTSGASAGLAAAFNAPVSGVMFALEEVHKNFSPLVLLSAMAASIMADFVCKEFLGLQPALDFTGVKVFPLAYYFSLPILGIILGILGKIFNKGILKSQEIYGILRKVPVELKVAIPFLITGIVGVNSPILLGGGHELIMAMSKTNFTLKILIIYLIIKFILTLICFGSGAPGGIFFPLLLLGALAGNIFGVLFCKMSNLPQIYIINFIIFAMAGHFAATVKAPITGVVLITEMTGSFEHLLALTIVVITSYLISEFMNLTPIYESLLERLLQKNSKDKSEEELKWNGKTKILLEISVCMESYMEEKLVKEIQWPENSLLVAIKRGDREIIPKGDTQILNGDYLVIMANEFEAAECLRKIKPLAAEEV
ncbi:chloride channel protein [Clostridium saccharoperbutylacetonicum]|uniref:ClC family H(+)/Cl(-) exchange transporter n=1 Tax=Clostridium saccharoperbutylacetonicum TaxID=36745 RepID=UPI0039ECE940